MMNIKTNEDFQQIIAENSLRPPTPGEVWEFSALEAHVFYEIFVSLIDVNLLPERDVSINAHFESFEMIANTDAFEEAISELTSPVLRITPIERDWSLFSSAIQLFANLIENDGANLQRQEQDELEAELGLLFSCKHSAKEHLDIATDWHKRVFSRSLSFHSSPSGRANRMVPDAEKVLGKQIYARSELERETGEAAKKFTTSGLYSKEESERYINELVNAGKTREEAEEIYARMRQDAKRKIPEELAEMLERKYRIIDGV